MQVADEFRVLPLSALKESPLNPRTSFEGKAMEELERSVHDIGKILVPLLVRPNGNGGTFEILAGARRFRAASKAGIAEVPVRVMEGLTDAQALEVMLIENLQRADVHPLEEARGYKKLISMGPGPVRAADLAAKVGKSEKYVYDRLKLLDLTDAAQKHFESGGMEAGHAILLARLDADDQREMLKQLRTASDWSVRDLEEQIRWHRHNKEMEKQRAQDREDRKVDKSQRKSSPESKADSARDAQLEYERRRKLDEIQRKNDQVARSKTLDAVMKKLGDRELPRAAWLLIANTTAAGEWNLKQLGRKPQKPEKVATAKLPHLLLEYALAQLWSINEMAKAAKQLGVEAVKPEKAKLVEEEKPAKAASKASKRPKAASKKG